MLTITRRPEESIYAECSDIQSFLEQTYSTDNPADCEQRGKKLEVYMARSGKMFADAKHWQDTLTNSIIMETMKDVLGQNKMWSASLIMKKVNALCADYNYLVTWCDRINRSCTHQLDFIRTLISKHKAEMQAGYSR